MVKRQGQQDRLIWPGGDRACYHGGLTAPHPHGDQDDAQESGPLEALADGGDG